MHQLSNKVDRRLRHFAGTKYGMLTLLHLVERKLGGNKWLVRCDCGTEKVMYARDVCSGHTQSCGCTSNARRAEKHITHGLTETREYSTWCHILGRCNNPTDHKYSIYGGRGIKVCERWQLSFVNFLEDMGAAPVGHSIDRINNDGNYEPNNCRWANAKTQASNRRNVKKVLVFGNEMIAADAERFFGLHYYSIRQRANDLNETLQEAANHFCRKYPEKASALNKS